MSKFRIFRYVPLILLCVIFAASWSPLPAAELRPVSVQMHLHGSLSEGSGSMEWQADQAEAAGVDVLWWTDHDWRVLYHKHVDGFDFENATHNAPENRFEASYGNVPWLVKWWELENDSLPGAASLVTGEAYDGSCSLMLEGVGDGCEWRELSCGFGSLRQREKRSLISDVSLGIAVKVEEPLGSDAQVFVDVTLSQHPTSQHRLEYVISDFPDNVALAPETIPLTYTAGAWAFYELPVTADAERVYPNGDDNSLLRVALGMRARGGTAVRAFFDSYEIHHDPDFEGGGLLEKQARILERYDEVLHLVGTEVSYHYPHLNVFCDGLPTLLDYDIIDEDNYAETAVTQAHAQGCLVSYNHPFGTRTGNVKSPEGQEARSLDIVAELLANNAWGADILEVGYITRGGLDLEHHIRTWDRLTANGLFLCGNGTSDAHEGEWMTRPNRMVSWVWSAGEDAASLLAGLRDCRLYFGDIYLWDGELDLIVGGTRMGDKVVMEEDEAVLEIALDPVPDGEIRLVQGVIQPGLNVEYVRDGEVVDPGSQVVLDTTRSSFVRIEVWQGETPVVFSNPVRVARPVAPYYFPFIWKRSN